MLPTHVRTIRAWTLPFLLGYVLAFLLNAKGAAVPQASSYAQRAVLLSEGGSYPFVSVGDQDVADLTTWHFNNQAHAACVIGIWLLYDLVNYNAAAESTVEYVFGQQYCSAGFETDIGGRVSSLRPVGARRDYTLSTLTVYSGLYFQGQAAFSESELPDLTAELGDDNNAWSLMVTGAAEEKWTLYRLSNYSQVVACVFPIESEELYAPGALPDIGAFLGPIGSARIGCPIGVRAVGIPSLGRSRRL